MVTLPLIVLSYARELGDHTHLIAALLRQSVERGGDTLR
jgi:hypothetical protein